MGRRRIGSCRVCSSERGSDASASVGAGGADRAGGHVAVLGVRQDEDEGPMTSIGDYLELLKYGAYAAIFAAGCALTCVGLLVAILAQIIHRPRR